MHNFRVQIEKRNLEGQKAIEIASSNLICVTFKSEVLLYSNLTLELIGSL
jgi:hypothetical protein